MAAVLILGGIIGTGWSLRGAHLVHLPLPMTVHLTSPCGGENLEEDSFPAMALPSASQGPGGTSDAPGAPDGRPEEFVPNPTAFQAVLDSVHASVRMSEFQTGFTHASPSQAANIALTARRLNGTVVRPGAVFSYNDAAGPFTAQGGYGWGRMFVGNRIVPTIGGGVCQGASTLYNVVLLANLQVVERHAHGLTVPYLEPGRDATVTESGGLDFRFRNNYPWPVVLYAQAQQRKLSIAVWGQKAPPPVRIRTEVLQTTPFTTEYITDRSLAPGQERVAAAGQGGATVRTWVVVGEPGAETERYLGQHTYRPSPRVILRGPTTN